VAFGRNIIQPGQADNGGDLTLTIVDVEII